MANYAVAFELKVLWLIGISLSTVCLIIQILFYILIPSSRKLDQKLLTQLSVARLLNAVFEYIILNINISIAPAILESVFAVYVQTDAALIFWMFVFIKNLYDNVINVLREKIRFDLVSVTIWIVTLPIGLLCPLFLTLDYETNTTNYFNSFYHVYSVVKFVILSVNLVMFCIVFIVAIRRSRRSVGVLRMCVVCSILVSISSLQVFLNDILSLTLDNGDISRAFGIVNSYQVLAMTTLFVILVESTCDVALTEVIAKKLRIN